MSETREQAWYRSATDKRSAARRASGSLSRSYYRWYWKHPGSGRWGTERPARLQSSGWKSPRVSCSCRTRSDTTVHVG